MLTRDELIEVLQHYYAPDDKIIGVVWGWDSVADTFDPELYPELCSDKVAKRELALKIWEKCQAEVDEVVNYVMNSHHTETIDQVIAEAVEEELTNG